VRAGRTPAADVPEALQPAWRDLLRGRTGRALALAREVEADPARSAGAPDRAAFEASVRALRERAERPLAQAAALAEAGLYQQAAALLARELGAARGDEAHEARVRAAQARFEHEVPEAERAAEREFQRVLGRFLAAGGDAAAQRDLEQLAARVPGTAAARQAGEWLALARPPVR
jgi:hypothetical protein